MPAKIRDILFVGGSSADSAIMASLGHRVFPVARGVVARTMLTSRPFDLMLVAGDAEDMPAVALIESLRSAEDAQTALTLVAAVASGDGQRAALLAAGADEVLAAPLTRERVEAALSALLPEPSLEAVIGLPRFDYLLGLFLQTLREQRAALAAGEETAEVAHRIKGAAANLGFHQLRDVAARAEEAPADGMRREALRLRTEAVIVEIEDRLARNNH